MNLREWILNSSRFFDLLPRDEVDKEDFINVFGIRILESYKGLLAN